MRAAWARIVATALCAAALAAPAIAEVRGAEGGPALVDDLGRSVRVPAAPRRIVSLSPALTEAVCLLGACERLVGVDRDSNWPASAQRLPRLGGLADTPLEALLRLEPDLVLAATSVRAVPRLAQLGVPVLALEPRRLAEVRGMLVTVARAIGRPDAAAPAWAALQQRLDAQAARVPAAWRGKRVYFEVASTPFAAGEASFIGELLARLGLVDIVPTAMGPFPQLNPEFILRAAPDLVMAARADWLAMPARPGLGRLEAVRERRGCGFAPGEADVLMRAGPRLAEAAEAIVACLERLDAAAREPQRPPLARELRAMR